jgi:hypothetical protein
MSKEVDNIRQKLARRFTDAASGSSYGIVKKVDEEKRTCDVEIGNIVREKVMLYLIDDPEDPKKGWWFVPKKESVVLVSRVDAAGTRLRVSMFSEIDRVVCTMEDTEFSISKDGYKLNRGNSGLLKTLTDLCSALERMTIAGGKPINVAEFTLIKQGLKTYLES